MEAKSGKWGIPTGKNGCQPGTGGVCTPGPKAGGGVNAEGKCTFKVQPLAGSRQGLYEQQ